MLFRHTTDKPFVCDYCNYQCKLQHDLNRHIRLRHSSQRSPSASSGAPPSVQHNSVLVMDADLDVSESRSTSTPVLGPLAAAGALSLLKPSDTFTSTVSDAIKPVPSSHPSSKPHWITCPQPGCRFRTTKRLGYLVHIGRKHSSVIQSNPLANLDGDAHYDGPNSGGSYACHLCPVTKRRGFDLSKHLMRDHQLNRPTGHVRFNYTLSADGHYRLQLTRLDTVSVATAVLGENVVSGLLPASS
ncbi:unnamed protein product [Dicrocoelium dendriticum]|nr:unnamed protein product [Dicrocoelium dendriticum]